MIDDFEILNPLEIDKNIFQLIGQDWMLITAGNMDSFNTMTASRGGMGVLWNKNVCFCVVRPTRYTYNFMEKSDYFTLSFFEEKFRDVLNFCGTHSGRNVNKIEKTGLTPEEGSKGGPFLDDSIEDNYPKKDYHRLYIGEIIRVLKKKQ
jgi:flavin reductase (DIM6/NTAB) family NADH-FMN oxidoreductase RutF